MADVLPYQKVFSFNQDAGKWEFGNPTSNASNSQSGLINTPANKNITVRPGDVAQANSIGYIPSSASASTYTPTNWDVNGNQTVQSQLRGIIDPNSPLMQQAQTYAQQQAQSRGLLNSSLAVSGAEGAQIERALPIAQQDASTYANSGQFNANAANQAGAQNAQLKTQTSQFNANAGNTASQFGAASANQAALQNATQANNYGLTLLTTQTQKDIANMNSQSQQALQKLTNDHDTLIRQDSNAATLYQQYVTNMGNISTSNQLDAAAKDTAINNQLAALQQGLDLIQHLGGLNLSQYFQKSNAPLNTPAPNAGTNLPPEIQNSQYEGG